MWIGKGFLIILLRFISHTCNIITIIIHEDFTTSIAALLFLLYPSLRHYSLWIFKNYNSILLYEVYQQISWYYIRISSFKKSDWSRYMIYFLLLKWDNDLLQCLWKHAQSQNNYAPCSFELVKYKLWSKCLKTWHLTEKVDLTFFNLRQIWREAWLLFKIMTSEQRCIILKLKLTMFFSLKCSK